MTHPRPRVLRASRFGTLIGTALAVAAVSFLPAASVGAQPPAHWATVNICNTPRGSYYLGVRGQMSGRQNGGGLYMRFTAQYRANGRWHPVGGSPTSSWQHARDRGSGWSQQMGYRWTMLPPAPNHAYVLRGVVDFQWRSGSRVLASAQAVTSSGHPNDHGTPAGYSAAQCTMTLASTPHARAAPASSRVPTATSAR